MQKEGTTCVHKSINWPRKFMICLSFERIIDNKNLSYQPWLRSETDFMILSYGNPRPPKQLTQSINVLIGRINIIYHLVLLAIIERQSEGSNNLGCDKRKFLLFFMSNRIFLSLGLDRKGSHMFEIITFCFLFFFFLQIHC